MQIRQFFKTVASASRVAAAVEANRRPNRADLRTLGIAEDAFSGINLR
ncbi:hypothetical protein [Mangrovicella endophytica]|nr:hypothetical protein [Mangrovicella endophytica]